MILFLISNFIWSETGFEILEKAKGIYEKTTKTQRPEETEKYKEITKLLKEAIEKTENQEIKKQIYPLLIETLDLSAEYREKHEKLKEYACLLYPEEKEKQATYLKQYADQLKEKGEIPEAIVFYRFIEKEYEGIEKSAEVLYEIARIIEEDEREKEAVKGTIEEYKKIIEKYPETKYAETSYFVIVKCYQMQNKLNEAIRYMNEFLSNYPESEKYEQGLFLLGLLYRDTKNEEKAKQAWEEYLKKYPEGVYSSIVRSFLKGGE